MARTDSSQAEGIADRVDDAGRGTRHSLLVVDFAGHAFGMDLSLALARRGHGVRHAYCSTNLAPHGDLSSRCGVEVHPISSGGDFEKYRLGRRVVSESMFGWRSARLVWRTRPDGVLTSNVPLISLLLIAVACRLRRSRWVFWLQDVQTGLATQSLTGVARIFSSALRMLERWLIRAADELVIISDDFEEEVTAAGRATSHTIRNWAVLSDLPVHDRQNPWALEHGFDQLSGLVFLYSGTLGRKHPPELLVELAQALDGHGHLIVVSEGEGADHLRQMVEDRSLGNVITLPFQPHDRLAEVLATGDVLVAVLHESAGSFSVPSKILSYLCAGRAILAAMPTENGASRMISIEAEAGTVVPPTPDGIRAGAQELLADAAKRRAYGRAGRTFAERTFDVDLKAEQFEPLLFSTTSFRQATEPHGSQHEEASR